MVNLNYIIREDNIGKTISEDGMLDAVDIEETLKSRYVYIFNSMKENNYHLTVNHCTYFNEILFKKQVVGFSAYTIINSVTNLSLVACYILPEFRGHGLFFDEINKVFEEGNQISIYHPPRFIIELLIKYGFAKKLDSNLVISSINMDIPSNSISNMFGTDKLLYEDYFYSSNIYDMNYCGFLMMPNEDMNIIYLTKAHWEDIESNENAKNRDDIDDKYYINVKECLEKNEKVIRDFLGNILNNYSLHEDDEFDNAENIDFETLKNVCEDECPEDILDNFEKLNLNRNSLLDDEADIDKGRYLDAYRNVAVYDFINIFEDNNNLDLTSSIIKIDYGFKNNYIKNYVLQEGYINNEAQKDEEVEYLNSLKVNELKEILKNNHLTVTGNKSDLIERIVEYVPSNMILTSEYHITDKGLNFIAEHEDIKFYNLTLKNYYYYEFREFLDEHDGSLSEVATLFLNEHLVKSVEKRDNKAYTDSLNALAYLNEKEKNYEKGLYYELKKFILGLNPIFSDEQLYNYYQPISESNVENIKLLLFKSKVDIAEEFRNAWDNMEIKDYLIPYEKSLKFLNQMISGDDRDYMNDKIREKYLTKKTISHDKLDKSVQSTLDEYLE